MNVNVPSFMCVEHEGSEGIIIVDTLTLTLKYTDTDRHTHTHSNTHTHTHTHTHMQPACAEKAGLSANKDE